MMAVAAMKRSSEPAAPPIATSRNFISLGKRLENFALGVGAFADHLPDRLGDVDRGGALSAGDSAIDYQIDTAVHHAENVDAAAAGGLTGNVRAGGNHRLVQHLNQLLRDHASGLPQRQAPGVAGYLEGHARRSGYDHRQRSRPEAA